MLKKNITKILLLFSFVVTKSAYVHNLHKYFCNNFLCCLQFDKCQDWHKNKIKILRVKIEGSKSK